MAVLDPTPTYVLIADKIGFTLTDPSGTDCVGWYSLSYEPMFLDAIENTVIDESRSISYVQFGVNPN